MVSRNSLRGVEGSILGDSAKSSPSYGPARRVKIGDDESEISLEWTDEDKDTK